MNAIGFTYLVKREIFRFTQKWHSMILSSVINSALFLIIFGLAVGNQLAVSGVDYAAFILSGLIINELITSPFHNASFSVFDGRFWGHINTRLAAPLSHNELMLSVCIGSITRGLIIAFAILLPFSFVINIPYTHPVLALGMAIITAFAAALGGTIIGLWADDFDSVGIIEPFVLMPLTFLGGVFYSIQTLPPVWQQVSLFNPFLYIVNSFRYTLIGVSDTDPWIGFAIVLVLAAILYLVVYNLYRTGWNLRD